MITCVSLCILPIALQSMCSLYDAVYLAHISVTATENLNDATCDLSFVTSVQETAHAHSIVARFVSCTLMVTKVPHQ